MTLPLKGHIDPTWDMNEISQLKMRRGELISSRTSVNIYKDAGHNIDQICVDVYFEPLPMPQGSDTIRQEFSHLNNFRIAVNCLHPGTYLPWHEDGYDRYMEITDVPDRNKIYRVIVMAEDSLPGQYLHVADTIHYGWKAGDWFAWYGPTLHATYNFSTKKRYAFQLTGTVE